jgi:hypothetical protein
MTWTAKQQNLTHYPFFIGQKQLLTVKITFLYLQLKLC